MNERELLRELWALTAKYDAGKVRFFNKRAKLMTLIEEAHIRKAKHGRTRPRGRGVKTTVCFK